MSIRKAAVFLWVIVVSISPCGAASAAEPAADMPIALNANDPSLKWSPCPPIFPAPCELAVLRGDPAKPNADAFLRVPAGYEIPPHWHTSAEHMMLASGELRVEYDGHPAVVLEPGTYAYGPAKAPHQAKCTSSEACVLFIAFEAPIDAHPVGAAKP